jgi:hypothetical protein
MQWMRVPMTASEARGQYTELMDSFYVAFSEAGSPEDVALFVSNPSSEDDAFYFTPVAAAMFAKLLKQRRAKSCKAPSRASVSLLVGSGTPQDMLA